jgi:hypothetical protein
MASDARPPPAPGPIVQPNFLNVEEAVADVTFPISKKELIEQVGDGTVLMQGRNVDLAQLIRPLDDDYFESEDEFRETLERSYGPIDAPDEHAPAALPTGPYETWQTKNGPGDGGGPDALGLDPSP